MNYCSAWAYLRNIVVVALSLKCLIVPLDSFFVSHVSKVFNVFHKSCFLLVLELFFGLGHFRDCRFFFFFLICFLRRIFLFLWFRFFFIAWTSTDSTFLFLIFFFLFFVFFILAFLLFLLFLILFNFLVFFIFFMFRNRFISFQNLVASSLKSQLASNYLLSRHLELLITYNIYSNYYSLYSFLPLK